MSLALVITTAGHARFTAAQVDDDIDLSVSHVGLTDSIFVAAPTLTALPGQFRALDTISGEAVGDSIVHMIIRDAEAIGYRVRGFGLYLADGTLFATYGQADAIFEKSPLTTMHLAIDIAFPTGNVDLLTFGDTNFLQPPATREMRGVAELATQEEVDAGADDVRIVTPLTLGARLVALLTDVMGAIADAVAERVPLTRRVNTGGLALGGNALTTDITISVPPATTEQVRAASASNVAITPAAIGALAKSLTGNSGHLELPGGFVVQWINHRGLISDEPSLVANYPVAFPTRCLIAIPTIYVSGASTGRDVTVQLRGEPGLASCGLQFQVASNAPTSNVDGYNLLLIGH